MYTNRRPAFRIGRSRVSGSWIRNQRSFPAAVGDPDPLWFSVPSVSKYETARIPPHVSMPHSGARPALAFL